MGQANVLIVDDERNLRLALKQALENPDIEVLTAANGEEALAQLEAHDVALMLLDLRMPGMDGMAVLRRVAAERPRVRVAVLTAHGTIESAVEALKLGAVDFLQKPFAPQEVRDLVTSVLARERLDEAGAADYESHLGLAKRSLAERRLEAAAEHLHRAIACEPNRPEAFSLLGMILEVEGKYREAMNNYRAALDFDPTYQPARENLTRASAWPHRAPALGREARPTEDAG